jgi:hypothetical protein
VGADRRQMSCRRPCRPPYRVGPRAGTTGRCGGTGTTRLSNWARHEHDGRRAGLCSGHAFSCRAWANPSCPCHLAMYTPPLLSTTRSQTQLGTHLRRGRHGGAVDVASRRSGEGATVAMAGRWSRRTLIHAEEEADLLVTSSPRKPPPAPLPTTGRQGPHSLLSPYRRGRPPTRIWEVGWRTGEEVGRQAASGGRGRRTAAASAHARRQRCHARSTRH